MNAKADRPSILVVDDDSGARDLICRVLKKSGFDVLVAGSGAAAIDLVTAYGPTIALVVLDMTMPVMNGEQTFEALHKLQPDLHFLIFTGGCDSDALLRLTRTGFCEHLIKPTPMADLVDKIYLMLAHHPR